MIEARHLDYRIGETPILTDVSLHVRPGEVLAILGPNGAGKSTLLQCLTGAIPPSAGTVLLDDTPLSAFALPELARRRAVLSQQTPISFPFTVMEIVLMGRNPYVVHAESADDARIAERALGMTDALHLKDRIFPSLSGGEQQRVQLARVLAQLWAEEETPYARYLFLDEPTAALDLKHQHMILQRARTLARQDIGVVCILHDINLAALWADRIVFLKAGKVICTGTPASVITPETIEAVYEIKAVAVRDGSACNRTLILPHVT